jgi:hypothetical protein
MIERQKRLKEVYEYVRKHFGIHTQSDFADALKYSRPVISSALNGNEDYLTDKLFKNVCEAFPGVFNLIYLLEGKSELTTLGEQQRINHVELDSIKQTSAQSPDAGFYKSVIDSQIQHIADLRKSNERLESMIYDRDATIQELRDEKERLAAEVSSLNAHIEHYKRMVGEEQIRVDEYKNHLDDVRISNVGLQNQIDQQKVRISQLEAELKARRDNPLYDYPHPLGVADERDK